LVDLTQLYPSAAAQAMARVSLWIFPRLDLYDGASWLIHGRAIQAVQWLWSVSYAILYVVAMLLMGRAAFARRSLQR
jgi:hypothetical protein